MHGRVVIPVHDQRGALVAHLDMIERRAIIAQVSFDKN